LLFCETRKHSYRAQTETQLLAINKNDFTKMFFQEFPDIGAEIYNNALKRRVRQNTSYKEALAYCKTQAKEKEARKEHYRPQVSNLSREKLKIRGKDLLENLMKRSESQEKGDEFQDNKASKEETPQGETQEGPKKFTLKDIIKFGRGQNKEVPKEGEENKDNNNNDNEEKQVVNMKKSGVSWKDQDEIIEAKSPLEKAKTEVKEAPKAKGWSLIRKKVKDMKKEARESMAGKIKNHS